MKSLIATRGTDAFVDAANKVVRREIVATFVAGRAITVLLDGQVMQLTREDYEIKTSRSIGLPSTLATNR